MTENLGSKYKPYIVRLLIAVGISFVLVVAFNELTYAFQKESYDRTPEVISIVIPEGTAQRIAAGELSTTIPEGLVFVVGDVLEVTNEDVESHQLGPLWIPAGATASLAMDQASNYSYSCSFRPNRYLDIDVRQATTWADRLIGISIGVPTVAVLLFLYSLAALPPDKKKKDKGNGLVAA